MRVMALFSTSCFAKCLRVGEDGPGRGYLCHTDTFLVHFNGQLATTDSGIYCASVLLNGQWSTIDSGLKMDLYKEYRGKVY